MEYPENTGFAWTRCAAITRFACGMILLFK